MKYKINIEEILSRVIEIEAEDDEDAENKVRKMYDSEEIVLSSEDLQEVDFYVQ